MDDRLIGPLETQFNEAISLLTQGQIAEGIRLLVELRPQLFPIHLSRERQKRFTRLMIENGTLTGKLEDYFP
jgi:hypothetical protein